MKLKIKVHWGPTTGLPLLLLSGALMIGLILLFTGKVKGAEITSAIIVTHDGTPKAIIEAETRLLEKKLTEETHLQVKILVQDFHPGATTLPVVVLRPVEYEGQINHNAYAAGTPDSPGEQVQILMRNCNSSQVATILNFYLYTKSGTVALNRKANSFLK